MEGDDGSGGVEHSWMRQKHSVFLDKLVNVFERMDVPVSAFVHIGGKQSFAYETVPNSDGVMLHYSQRIFIRNAALDYPSDIEIDVVRNFELRRASEDGCGYIPFIPLAGFSVRNDSLILSEVRTVRRSFRVEETDVADTLEEYAAGHEFPGALSAMVSLYARGLKHTADVETAVPSKKD